MKRAAIYLRVSSDRQAQEGDSIPAQRDALTKYIEGKPDLVFAGEYLDDGISGQKYQQRDELQRLLSDVQQKKIDIICFTKLDRWFRSVRHYTATQEILDKYNVGWIAIWEPIYDTTTPSGRLIANQMMSIAQYEAENTGLRINQVFRYKVEQGEVISGNTALGHKIVDKHIQLSDDAPIVKDLFEYYNFCGSLADLTRYAMEKYGLQREPSTWRTFLKNRKYIGEFRNNPNYCPPIVSKELFNDVQRRLSMNLKDNHRKNLYLFSGLLVCFGCGGIMTGSPIHVNSRNGVHHVYKGYRCHSYYSPSGSCTCSKRRYESTLEKYLVDNIPELSREYIIKEKEKPKTNTNAARIAVLNKKIAKLKELYVNDLISLSEYKEDKERYTEELQSIEVPVARDFSRLDDVQRFDFKSFYWTMTDEEKSFLWHSIIAKIYWSKDNQITVDFLP